MDDDAFDVEEPILRPQLGDIAIIKLGHKAALEKLTDSLPSLILLDLMMPVMDGFEFLVEMRKMEAWRGIPIVVVTAKDVTDEDRRRLNGNVVGLIQKGGLDREALLAQIREQVASLEPRDR